MSEQQIPEHLAVTVKYQMAKSLLPRLDSRCADWGVNRSQLINCVIKAYLDSLDLEDQGPDAKPEGLPPPPPEAQAPTA